MDTIPPLTEKALASVTYRQSRRAFDRFERLICDIVNNYPNETVLAVDKGGVDSFITSLRMICRATISYNYFPTNYVWSWQRLKDMLDLNDLKFSVRDHMVVAYSQRNKSANSLNVRTIINEPTNSEKREDESDIHSNLADAGFSQPLFVMADPTPEQTEAVVLLISSRHIKRTIAIQLANEKAYTLTKQHLQQLKVGYDIEVVENEQEHTLLIL